MKRIKFTYSFLFFIVLMLYISKYTEIIVISLSILLHELFHIIVSFIFGNRKVKLEITMFGGICNLDINKLSQKQRILVYLSGVIANIFIIIIFYYYKTIYSDLIIKYNLMLIIFSLLPIYPLDGYRILFEICNGKIIRSISYSFIYIILILDIYFKSIGILVLMIYLFMKQKDLTREITYNKLYAMTLKQSINT